MWLKMLFQMLPMFVQMAEILHPGDGNGPTKLNTVLTMATNVAAAVPALAANVAALRDPLTHVVNGVVGIMNSTGALKPVDAARIGEHIANAAQKIQVVGDLAPGAVASLNGQTG